MLPQQSSTLPVASAMSNLSSNLLLPSFMFFHISCELLEHLQTLQTPCLHSLALSYCSSNSHSHKTTFSTPFTLTLMYISPPPVLKSDLSYTDASLSLNFLFRRSIFELCFLRNVGKIHEQKMSIKCIKPDKTGESPFSH